MDELQAITAGIEALRFRWSILHALADAERVGFRADSNIIIWAKARALLCLQAADHLEVVRARLKDQLALRKEVLHGNGT